MNMLVVELIQFPWNIWEVGIEDRVSLGLPPIPVLHNGIERDVLLAISACNSQDLILRNVSILRLEKSIGPLGKQGRVPGEVSVLVDDLIQFGAINQVVIDGMACE
jgi:hypothetical protein